jgi:hypothetical protein
MSFVSRIADLVRGEFEITCFTDPELESSFHRERVEQEATERGTRDANGRSLGPSMQHSKTNGSRLGHIKPNSYAQKPPTKNKLVEYIKGETDILCFAPTPEDYSSTSARNSVDGLVPNTTDDEDDDLIYVDIGYNSRSKQSERHPANFMNATKLPSRNDSLPENHSSIRASSWNDSPTHHHMKHLPTLTRYASSHRQMPKDFSSASKESESYSPKVMNGTNVSSRMIPSSYNHPTGINPRNYTPKHASPYSERRLECDLNQLSLGTKRQGIGLITERPSPTNVITGFSSSNAPTQVDRSGIDFLNALYDRDNGNFIGNLLDTDDTELFIDEKRDMSDRYFNFESAGFSREEAMTIKRRIKLQKLVRSMYSGLSNGDM